LTSTSRYQIILIAVLRIVMNTGYRMVYPFLPVFAQALGVELTSISLALSARSLVGGLGPFLATIADRRGRKTGMLMGVGVFTLGAALVVIWPAFLPFVLALILISLGKAVFDPSIHAYVGDKVDYEKRATAIALIEMSWSLSFILGIPLIGYLIAHYGWTSPFTALGLAGFAILLILMRFIPSDRVNFANPPGAQPSPLWHNLSKVFTNRLAQAGLVFALLLAAANETINVVFGVWIEASFGVQLAALGAASAVIGFSELAGESLVSVLTDRLGKSRAIAAGIGFNCLSALLLPILGRSLPGALVGLFFFYLTFEFTLVSSIPLMTEILPGARATLLAANIAAYSVGRAVGDILAPPVYGLGIWANGVVTVFLNLLALLVLLRLTRAMQVRTSST
jgi:DHA1 family inner membrane transport protein